MVKLAKLIITVFLITTLISCGDQTPTNQINETSSQPPKKENNRYPGQKVYYHSMDGTPTTLDPVRAATMYSNFLVLNIFDTLYSYKYLSRPYELKTNLATAMPK